jgi:hypothetical protein
MRRADGTAADLDPVSYQRESVHGG